MIVSKLSGKKLPRGARQVLAVMEECGRMLTAKEICFLMKAKEPEKAPGLTTIYRSLELLSRLGNLQEIYLGDTEKRYELIKHEESQHSQTHNPHHITCQKCRETITLKHCLVNQLSKTLEAEYDFQLKFHVLEFLGLCSNCRQANLSNRKRNPIANTRRENENSISG